VFQQEQRSRSYRYTMVLKVSTNDFLLLGLHLVGFLTCGSTCAATNIRRFRAAFGTTPESCSKIFIDLQTFAPAANIAIKKHNASYFLMTLNWLRSYMVEETLAGLYNLSEKTVRKWIWDYTIAIQALKEQKVRRESTGTTTVSLALLSLEYDHSNW
jgi:hypothetical protein